MFMGLIFTLIIGMGMSIYSQSSVITDNATSSIEAIAANQTNAQLASYADTKVKGSTVKNFQELVKTLNELETFPKEVKVEYDGEIDTTKYYVIELSDTNYDGYYDLATVNDYEE